MTLKELKHKIDTIFLMRGRKAEELEVCIPNNKGGQGGTSVTQVTGAYSGIDWDKGRFIIEPENKMIELPQSK